MFDNAPVIWLANYNLNTGEVYETKMYKCVGYNRDDLQCAGNDYELDYLLWTAGQICSIFGVDVNTERIFDIRSIICPILTVGLYILACTITRKSQKKRTGLTISIIVLVSHIILNVLNVIWMVAVNRKYAFFMGRQCWRKLRF